MSKAAVIEKLESELLKTDRPDPKQPCPSNAEYFPGRHYIRLRPGQIGHQIDPVSPTDTKYQIADSAWAETNDSG